MQKKKCTKCGEEKLIDEFYKQPGGKDGILANCKKCKIAANGEYYRTHVKVGKEETKKKKVESVKTKSTDQVCDVLKRFQVDAVEILGNTIVSKKFKPDAIIKAYKKQGLDVEVLKFETKSTDGKDTFYKVLRK